MEALATPFRLNLSLKSFAPFALLEDSNRLGGGSETGSGCLGRHAFDPRHGQPLWPRTVGPGRAGTRSTGCSPGWPNRNPPPLTSLVTQSPLQSPNPSPTSSQACPQGCLGQDPLDVGQGTGGTQLGRVRALLAQATVGPGDQNPRTAAAPRAARHAAAERSQGGPTDRPPSAIRSDLPDAGDPPRRRSRR